MASPTCIIRNTKNFMCKLGEFSNIFPGLLQGRYYAARKSTREKARKKKIKIMSEKLAFKDKIKKIIKSKSSSSHLPDELLYQHAKKPTPVDDVYYRRYYTWKVYPFSEAISNYREYFDPTMYDNINSYVNIFVELNLKGVKKTKPVSSFQNVVSMKYKFDHGEKRKILAFCEPEKAKQLEEAGAFTAGGVELVNEIKKGLILLNDYNTVIAHTSLMAEVLSIRGLLRKKLPNIKTGTLGIDLNQLLDLQLNGINYIVKPFEDYPEYGHSTICIGKLNMDTEKLEENMGCIIDSIMSTKPKRPGSFITRIRLRCPNASEQFQIDHNLYIKEKEVVEEDPEEDEIALTI